MHMPSMLCRGLQAIHPSANHWGGRWKRTDIWASSLETTKWSAPRLCRASFSFLGDGADHRHLHAKACAWRRAPESLPGRAAQPEHLTQSADSSQQAT